MQRSEGVSGEMQKRWWKYSPDDEGAVLVEIMNLERGASFRTDICEFGLRTVLCFLFYVKKTKN